MSTFTTSDGTRIFFKDWGTGQPIVLSHGWPLSSDAWDPQLLFLVGRGYRVVAADRRGHGHSDQPARGNDMNTYADDLSELIEHLDLRDITLVGHSTGGGEVARYLGRHGTSRVARVVLLGAVPPLMLQTEANSGGLPRSVFDEIREGVRHNRSQYFRDLAIPFYGYNRDGAQVSQGIIDQFWRLGMQSGMLAAYECIEQFSETDFTQDLERIDVPTLIVHGDDDQIVPIGPSAKRAVELIEDAELKVYPGAPHGLATTMADELNQELLTFIEAHPVRAARGAGAPPPPIH